MRDQYKIKGSTQKIQIEVEESVAKILSEMEGYTKHSVSELANTAIKRFISSHKDFLPPKREK